MFSYLVLVVTQITHTEFGSAVTHSLKTGGESIPVTNSNRHGLFFFHFIIVIIISFSS